MKEGNRNWRKETVNRRRKHTEKGNNKWRKETVNRRRKQ